MKRWDLIHDSFPYQIISEYCNNQKKNKYHKAYSTYYNFHSEIYEENRSIKPPSTKCTNLREKIMDSYPHVFKEELGPQDRMKVEPVKLKLKKEFISPSFCSKPFDTPHHLRSMYEKELKRALDAGHLAPCGLDPSAWSSKAFPVVKRDGTSCRIVADFKRLNEYIERPVWPTESSQQLLRHINPDARYFATMDLTSGYHQIPLDEESQNLKRRKRTAP